MAFQFKSRGKQSKNQQYEKEIALLKDYNKALQHQNQSRQIQRKALQQQIARITKLTSPSNSTTVLHSINIHEQTEFITLNQQYTLLNQQYNLLNHQYSQLKSKYDNLLCQNSKFNNKIITNQSQSSQNIQLQKQKQKFNKLLKEYQSKIIQLQKNNIKYAHDIAILKANDKSNTNYITQYQSQVMKTEQLQAHLKVKTDEGLKLKRQIEVKQEQLMQLKRDLTNYSHKVDSLSQQLFRLEKFQKMQKIIQKVVYVQKQEVSVLRSRLEQINITHNTILNEKNILRQQNHSQRDHILDLERRISILEEANSNLQGQLRMMIQTKNNGSRMIKEEQHQLKQAIFNLKEQLQQAKAFNLLVRQENESLFLQLKELKGIIQFQDNKVGKWSNSRMLHRHNGHSKVVKSRSKSPYRVRQQDKYKKHRHAAQHIYSYQHQHTPPELSSLYHANANNFSSGICSSLSPSNVSFNQKGHTSVVNVESSSKYNDIQRKIQMLQQQNKVLKQKLIYEV